uniref:DUF7748 domain-containing protein n=1 Tax=Physcomitrium patens TaxID=3218 RepID=A9REF6_PHYPA|nr:hypothetical protein PHYPA_021394 [Physcomitrium patens]
MVDKISVIVNNTQQNLDMLIGNHRSFEFYANLPMGAKHNLRVDFNDTYHEFLLGVDKAGKRLIVTSDDCCDYKCIIITEADGMFNVKQEPRMQYRHSEEDHAVAPTDVKKRPTSSWKFWKH